MEGGQAKESNVGVIKQMLPTATDFNSGGKTAQAKLHNIREFIKANRDAFMKTATAAGATMPNGAGGDTVRVKNKATGATGSMPAANFDPSKYEKL
jgi:hypothetical protein